MAAAVSALDFDAAEDMRLNGSIERLGLAIPSAKIARMSIAEKRIFLDGHSRINPNLAPSQELYFRMADSHSNFFTNLNFNSYQDFVSSIAQKYSAQPNDARKLSIEHIGYVILQSYFIDKISEIEKKLKQKAEYIQDPRVLEKSIKDRYNHFNSPEFIRSLGERPPDKKDVNSKNKMEGSYSNFLDTIFQTSLTNTKINWRNVIESSSSGSLLTAQDQCIKILRSDIRKETQNCYICGLPIEILGGGEDFRGYKTGECEHLLPILLAVENLWICKERNPHQSYRDNLQIEYKWSHKCCNRIKTSVSLIWYNYGAPTWSSVNAFDPRAAEKLLVTILSNAQAAANQRNRPGVIIKKKKQIPRPAGQGEGVTYSDCLQIYDKLDSRVFTSPNVRRAWINHRINELGKSFTPITELLNNTRVYTNVHLSLEIMGKKGLIKGGQHGDMGMTRTQQEGLKEMYNRFKLFASISHDFLDEALMGSELFKMQSVMGEGLGKSIIGNKKLIKKELQKSKSKLKKLLDIGNRLKLELDYRNKKYDTKNDDSLFNFKLNYMRKSLGNEILDSIKNITNKKSLYNWIDEMFLKIKNLPKDTKEFETSVKKNHKQLSQVDDKVKIFNIKDKKNKAKGIKKKKYIAVNIKLYPKLKTVPKLAFIPISLVSSKILTSLNKLNIENYKLIELKTSVSNDLSYFLIEFNLDIDKKYDKNLINSQIKNLFNNESFLLDINENSISSFPIFDKVNVSISNLNNKTKNKHSRGKGMRSKGMRSKGMRIRKAKGIRKTNKNKKTKKTKKKRKN